MSLVTCAACGEDHNEVEFERDQGDGDWPWRGTCPVTGDDIFMRSVNEGTRPDQTQLPGRKDDAGKLRYDLVPVDALRAVTEVLTFGAKKYAPDNWRHVPDPRGRYTAALLRHVYAWMDGEEVDAESGCHHLAHAGCCLLFLLHFALKGDHR